MTQSTVISELRIAILKALCDPVRLSIVYALKDGERCVCELIPLLKRSQSTVSKDLDMLYRAGILNRRIDGKRTIYSVTTESVFKILEEVDKIAMKTISGYAKTYAEMEKPAPS
ncbi:MAG: metalloregulator ArsR/SmtB family transcription factor [Candidatus Verstraetearchaeota archaeon]|nr:metalloregulator ArsR/SmtB family transcription factor [Candidatus Verstraetearchaeota archaeon]